MSRYMPGDKVSYVGEKLKQDFGNALGIVHARIDRNPEGYVVDFGSDSIVVHESKLAPFQGHLRGEDESKKKEPKVEKRRSRRRDSEDEE